MKKARIQKLSEKKYYELMLDMLKLVSRTQDFDELHKVWFDCFTYIFRRHDPKATASTIKVLFYQFQMSNWTALHKESTEYKGQSKKALLYAFASECSYICDRVSLDRLFRTHWLFLKAFTPEMWEIEEG